MLVNLVAIAYVISGVLFITALRGLSSPDSSRTGNILGMAGMTIAVIATLFSTEIIQDFSSRYTDAILVLSAIIIGGVIGAIIAKRIAMTDMPQLVAAFHSLVGLAAVFVAVAAFYDPEAFGIFDNKANHIHTLSIVELSIGAVVGVFRAIIGFFISPEREWTAVTYNLQLYMVQAYPESDFIRVWITVGLLIFLLGLSWGFNSLKEKVSIKEWCDGLLKE